MSKESSNVIAFPTSDDFLSAAARVVIEEVYVPATGHTLYVKNLNAQEVQRARADIVETRSGRTVPRQDRDFSAMVAYYAACNKDGTPYFRRDQIEALNTRANYAAVQPISRVALRLSGLDEEAAEADRKKHDEGTRAGD